MAANVFRNTIAVWGSYIASKKMHESLLSHVLILPMAFFDSQPLGRLLNRFTKDTEAVDVELLKLVSDETALLCSIVVSAGSISTDIVTSQLIVKILSLSDHIWHQMICMDAVKWAPDVHACVRHDHHQHKTQKFASWHQHVFNA